MKIEDLPFSSILEHYYKIIREESISLSML